MPEFIVYGNAKCEISVLVEADSMQEAIDLALAGEYELGSDEISDIFDEDFYKAVENG